MAAPEYCGKPYRQIVHKLRIQRGPGNMDKVSFRPRQGNREQGWGAYLDSDAEPTLVVFDELDQVDVPQMLRTGVLVEWAPQSKPADASKEVDDGEGR